MAKYELLSKTNKPKKLTKLDKEVYKNDNQLKKDFKSDVPDKKFIGNITQLPTADGRLYIGLTFDCFDN
ncbi:MAG: hypothetical protein FWE33_00385 [Defluviitaleaceae bacterium]|nr:hypothetical protein [Defluviitaleaceae bacterium]